MGNLGLCEEFEDQKGLWSRLQLAQRLGQYGRSEFLALAQISFLLPASAHLPWPEGSSLMLQRPDFCLPVLDASTHQLFLGKQRGPQLETRAGCSESCTDPASLAAFAGWALACGTKLLVVPLWPERQGYVQGLSSGWDPAWSQQPLWLLGASGLILPL